MKRLVAVLLAILTFSVHAQNRVVGISDGDTLTILDGSTNQQTKIRISAIDAPEKAQPFGSKAKQALSDLCFGKFALIHYVDTDQYGRTVANVKCEGTDVGRYMVSRGYAWVYDKYSSGHDYLYPLQRQARSDKRGLWSDGQSSITPPWEWRRQN